MQKTGQIDQHSLGCRSDFAVFDGQQDDQAYLDSAASAQKPRIVLSGMEHFSSHSYANIHRGVYRLSEAASLAYEGARTATAQWIGALPNEIVFTTNATMAFNLVAHSFLPDLKDRRGVLATEIEHHSNFLPWQQVCKQTGRPFRVAPCHNDGTLDIEAWTRLLKEDIGLVVLTHISNVLGTEQPLADLVKEAHRHNALVLVDGCQAVPHTQVNVAAIGCDFYGFSAHKMYGPSGIGVLFGRHELLDAMSPMIYGGGMVSEVGMDDSTWAPAPMRFEAGTPPIVEAIGLHKAINYLNAVGMDRVTEHGKSLGLRMREAVTAIKGVTVYGPEHPAAMQISFNVDNIHAHDLATILDKEGVAVRAGHHCSQPMMRRLGVAATIRASLGIYNEYRDIERLAAAIMAAKLLMRA